MRRRKRNVDDLVERTLAGEPVPEGELEDPGDAQVLRAAIELRSARPAADLPSDEFVARLRRQINFEAAKADVLRAEIDANAARPSADVPSDEFLARLRHKIDTEATSSDVSGEEGGRRLSRRSLLAGAGAAAAVAGVVGAVSERTIAGSSGTAPVAGRGGPLVPNGGGWVPVKLAANVQSGSPQRFATANVVGFVTEHQGSLVAVSGVCTHMGCLLRSNPVAGRLDCPCHRTSFGPDGAVLFSQLETQPEPLPKIGVRSRNDAVEVFVPRET